MKRAAGIDFEIKLIKPNVDRSAGTGTDSDYLRKDGRNVARVRTEIERRASQFRVRGNLQLERSNV